MGCDFGWYGVAPDPEARRESVRALERLAETAGWSYQRLEGVVPGPFMLRTDLRDAEAAPHVTALDAKRKPSVAPEEDGFTRTLTNALNQFKRADRLGYPKYHCVEALPMEGLLIYPLGSVDSDGLPRRPVPWLFLGAASGWLPEGTVLSIVDPRCPEEQYYSGDPDVVAACEDAMAGDENVRGVKTGFMDRGLGVPWFLDIFLHLKLRYVRGMSFFDDYGDCTQRLLDADASSILRQMTFGDLASFAFKELRSWYAGRFRVPMTEADSTEINRLEEKTKVLPVPTLAQLAIGATDQIQPEQLDADIGHLHVLGPEEKALVEAGVTTIRDLFSLGDIGLQALPLNRLVSGLADDVRTATLVFLQRCAIHGLDWPTRCVAGESPIAPLPA